MLNVWLDDVRPAPEGFVWVKTAEEAIALLYTNNVEIISLDHDLGTLLSGYDVACAIEKGAFDKTLQKLRVRIHSQNPVGVQKMKIAIQNAYKYWQES